MANIYVRNAGSNTSPYDTWAKAATTMSSALGVATNADTIWVADDHAETYTADTTWTLPTSPGLRILGANTHATEPPTGLANKTATITTTTNAADLIINGFAYFYGLQFNYGDSTDQCLLQIAASNGLNHGIVMDNCGLANLPTSGTSDGLRLGPAGTNTAQRSRVVLRNPVIAHKSTGVSATGIGLGNGQIVIDGLTLAAASNGPTTGFIAIGNGGHCNGNYLLENCDFSNLNTACPLFNIGTTTSGVLAFRNSKIASGATLTAGTLPASGPKFFIHNVDSTDSNLRFQESSYQGTCTSQTGTLVKSGGAEQDTVAYSIKMVGNASSELFWSPLESPTIVKRNTTVGSAQTATVEILSDNATNLQNDEVWLELSYLNTSGFPLGTTLSDRMTDILSTPADQTASSVTWDSTGMSNPNKQKLEVSFTAQEAGHLIAKVMLAKNTTIYVDPEITLS